MSRAEPPTTQTSAAVLAEAIKSWQVPAAMMSSALLPNAIGRGRNRFLEAAFVDPARTSAVVSSLRAADPARQAALQSVVGSSVMAQIARPSATPFGPTVPKGAISSLATAGQKLALIAEAVNGPARAVQKMLEQANTTVLGWQPQFERFGLLAALRCSQVL
jgi:hypothetical protein